MRKEQQRENLFVFVVRCLQWTTIIERTFTATAREDRYAMPSFKERRLTSVTVRLE